MILPPEEQEHEHLRAIDLRVKITTDYLGLNTSYERVRLLKDAETGWNGPKYYRRHTYPLDTREEIWKSHEMLL